MNGLAVCSWSLQPTDHKDLATKVKASGLSRVQLALDPLRTGAWKEQITAAHLREQGIQVISGMMSTRGEDYSTLRSIERTGGVRSDEHWGENLLAAQANAALARRLELPLVTLHAGFLPHDPESPLRATMVTRLRQVLDALGAQGVDVGLETGQEDADTLLSVLDELGRMNAGVNFDPANMILYGKGDPVEALRRLAPHVRQIHIKDAIAATTRGEWGTEVPVGEGGVDWREFFAVVREADLDVGFVIERESGEQRIEDVRTAMRIVGGFLS
jgi:sugar phosphate isomerase/epimerase